MATPKSHRPPTLTSTPGLSLAQLLQAFQRLLRQTHLRLALQQTQQTFYDRLFSPTLTLWYMVFQRLQPDHSLQAAVCDAHRGGADRLGPRERPPLSQRIRSQATTALSNARQRLPLRVFHAALAAQAQQISHAVGQTLWHGWRVLLLDGSQVRLRPWPGVAAEFSASANQCGPAYWVLMRVVAVFCWHSGLVLASAAGATTVSEQALACPLFQNLGPSLWLGDANFGIFWLAQAITQANSQALLRLTPSRAGKLLGSRRRLNRVLDQLVLWSPSPRDRRRQGATASPLHGRLLATSWTRPGFRTRWLYLFTTLVDAQAYPAQELVRLYGQRWQVELDLRYLKVSLDLDLLECKSAAMAQKEWLAGLMAYNLVRALMVTAARKKHLPPKTLSFSATRRLLLGWLADWSQGRSTQQRWEALLADVAAITLPVRAQPRPSEPRCKRHIRETFPPLRGSRAEARQLLQQCAQKS